MEIFKKKKNGGFRDVIRCDEPSYLIWKWHPGGTELGESKREYAIRTCSTLRVKDGELAVFVYKQKDGTLQDFIKGPFEAKIKTGNFPVLSNIIGLFYEGDTPFQAEVYFVNLAEIIQVKFGVPFFNVCDPRYPDFSVPVAVRGTITFKIEDYKKFITYHRLDTFNLSQFQNQIRDVVNRYVKDVVANAPAEHNINVIQLESKTAMINDIVELNIKDRFLENFAVTVTGVDIGAIEIDKDSYEYLELKRITKDLSSHVIEGQALANLENYKETLRIQREEQQYSMHKQTQTANLDAFQIEQQAQVGIAGAEALAHMGENEAGNVNLGGNAGFNPAAMLASVNLGGAVGQNIVNTMSRTMNQNQQNVIPPPVPVITYYVAVNGNATGPYEFTMLKQMAISGELSCDSLVWTQGMTEWKKVKDVEELLNILKNSMTSIPSE